jgi:hypothetical protein
MAHSKSSATRVAAAERRTKALELRKQGKSFGQIGAEMGVSEQRAHALVTQELQRLNQHRSEEAAAVCRLEVERLDEMFAGLWAQARQGDGPAIDRALAIMARRAKLLGLEAAEKHQVSGQVTTVRRYIGVDVEGGP